MIRKNCYKKKERTKGFSDIKCYYPNVQYRLTSNLDASVIILIQTYKRGIHTNWQQAVCISKHSFGINRESLRVDNVDF